MARVLVIADSQKPFDHVDYLEFLKCVQAKYRTTSAVHVGDEIDHHALGDYDHDPDGFSAGHELLEAIKHLKPYYKVFPTLKLCESNHTARILRRAFKSGIPRGYLREFREVIGAPMGWEWNDKWELDGVIYKHGLGYSGTMGALNAAKDELKPCVIGHLHADAGILFWSNGKDNLFGMNVGSGIDNSAYAFRYGKDLRKKPILSCGVVINRQPHLIIMNTYRERWDGKV